MEKPPKLENINQRFRTCGDEGTDCKNTRFGPLVRTTAVCKFSRCDGELQLIRVKGQRHAH